MGGAFQLIFCLLDQVGLDISESPDVYAVDVNDPGDGFRSPIAQADESDTYLVYFGSRIAAHIEDLWTGWPDTGRSGGFLGMPVGPAFY